MKGLNDVKKRPNIILIMTDEMRGDCMGIAGHPDVKTPYLDTMASQGVYFPNAYTTCPSCIAARAVLHTGRSPAGCGRVGYEDRVEWNYTHTMAGMMKELQYHTYCVGKMHVYPPRRRMGFDHVELHDGYVHALRKPDTPNFEDQRLCDDYFYWLKKEKGADADVMDTGLDCNSWIARPWIYEEKYHPTNWVTDRTLDFFRTRDRDEPFFLMVSYVRPHAPYDPPQAYWDMYRDKALRPPVYGDWDRRENLEKRGRIFNSDTGPLDPELIQQQQAGYYACITHMDHQIGRILEELTVQDLLQDTFVLFTADHGELLSDHCCSRKVQPYQGSIRIPMILWGPKSMIGPGRTDESLVGLEDVIPTFLEAAGETELPDWLEGKSMLHPGREMMFGEHSYGPGSHHFIVTREDKYIWFSQSGKEQYFRLDTDPGETHDAAGDPAYRERIKYLRNELVRHLAGREEGYSDGEKLIIGCTPKNTLKHASDFF